jgi:hypothetical protein
MSTGPRNRAAWRRGQRIRAEIRSILEAHSPLLPPLTAKAARVQLTIRPLPSVRTVQWHTAAIRTDAILAEANTLQSAQFIA